jgi:hypothetical protein
MPLLDGSDAPVVPPTRRRPATSWRRSCARTGPSSWQRQRAPAPAGRPSGPRPRRARGKPQCAGGRERARREHRPSPWRPASQPSASSSTRAVARLGARRTARNLVPCPCSTDPRSAPTQARAAPSEPGCSSACPRTRGPPPLLAGTARLSRRPGPGTDTRSPTWRPASSPQRSPASARTGTTSRYGPVHAAVRACSSASVSAWPSRLAWPLVGFRTDAATLC